MEHGRFEPVIPSRCTLQLNQETKEQMSQLAEGNFPCVVLSGKGGEDDRGVYKVQINIKFTDGPSAGQLGTYEDSVDAKSAPFVIKSCKAVGWKGETLNTLTADIAAWIAKTGGATTGEVKHILIKNGKRAGQIWDKVSAIGRGSRDLATPKPSTLKDADEAMRRAMADDHDGPSDTEDKIPF